MSQTNTSGVNQSQNNVIITESKTGSITVASNGGVSYLTFPMNSALYITIIQPQSSTKQDVST